MSVLKQVLSPKQNHMVEGRSKKEQRWNKCGFGVDWTSKTSSQSPNPNSGTLRFNSSAPGRPGWPPRRTRPADLHESVDVVMSLVRMGPGAPVLGDDKWLLNSKSWFTVILSDRNRNMDDSVRGINTEYQTRERHSHTAHLVILVIFEFSTSRSTDTGSSPCRSEDVRGWSFFTAPVLRRSRRSAVVDMVPDGSQRNGPEKVEQIMIPTYPTI